MAFDTRDLLVKIKGDTSDFEKSIGGVTKSSDGAGLSFAKLTAAVAAGEAIFNIAKVGVEKLAGFLGDTIKSANASENAMAQLNTVLKSTGGAAGIATNDLTNQAAALQKLTTFSDEAIMSAQSLLLTFTGVKGGVFKEAIPVILDMSQALGQDLKSSTIQLGKALNDPIQGINALRRVGVSFTQQQRDQIEQMVNTNRTVEAQRLILKELRTEFGGSAEAAGKTFAGSMERLKNQIDDVKEAIGGAMVQALTPFMQKAADFVAKIDWESVINRTVNAITRFKDTIVNTYTAVYNYLAPGIQRFAFILGELWHILEERLGPSFRALGNTIQEKLMPQLMELWNAIEPGFTAALKVVGVIIGTVVVAALWLLINALNALADVLGFVIRVVNDVTKWFGNFYAQVINLTKTIIDFGKTIYDVFSHIPSTITSALRSAADAIISPFKAAFDWIDAQITRISNAFDKLKSAANAVKNAPSTVKNTLGGLLDKIPGFATGVENFSGGLAYVHQGELLTNLPPGTNVIPKQEVNQMLQQSEASPVNITVNVGMYAGMPVEKREIALSIYKEIVRAARAQGVSMPMIGAVGVQ